MNLIQLSYLTDTGCSWLENNLEVTDDNYEEVIDSYYERTISEVKKLESRWQSDGETTQLSLDADPIDCDTELFNKVYRYIDLYY